LIPICSTTFRLPPISRLNLGDNLLTTHT